MRTTPDTARSTPRFAAIDALRGLAMVWMTVFHFCFDLNHFGYWHTNFYQDPLWLVQRICIVSLFVFCAGLSQAIAIVQQPSWAQFGRRWGRIVLGALLVSAGSYAIYPKSFIYFGILHGIAAMLLLVRALAAAGMPARGWWALSALALALPSLAAQAHALWPALDWLNTPWANWLGLISRKPITEDYAPLLPWLGVMGAGVACGQWLLGKRTQLLTQASAACVHGPLAWLLRPLARLGQWSLSYYLLHQPVLFGAFMLLHWMP